MYPGKINIALSVLAVLASASTAAQVGYYPYPASAHPQELRIVFDLGNTLFKTSKMGVGHEVGLRHFIGYTLLDRKNPKKIENLIFNILHSIKPLSTYSGARHMDGQVLPEVMNDWLSGRQTAEQIIKQALQATEHYAQAGYFSSRREKRLVEKTIQTMFDPYKLAKHMHPVKGMIKILEKCKQRNNISLSILSNLSTDVYNAWYYSANGQKVLKHFDPRNIMISGNTGLVKPQRAFYELYLKTYNLDPRLCILIDDQPENIDAARQCGMTGILFRDSRQLERDLRAYGIL